MTFIVHKAIEAREALDGACERGAFVHRLQAVENGGERRDRREAVV